MSLLVIGVVLVILCVNFKHNRAFTVIFALSVISLFISLKTFWNTAIFVDEYGTSPTAIYGGDFWLNMSWLHLGLLFVVCVISGFKVFSRPNPIT